MAEERDLMKDFNHIDDTYVESGDHIKSQCEQLWKNVNQLQDEVVKVAKVSKEDDASEKIMAAKIERLKSEIEVVNNFIPQALPNDPRSLHVLLKDDITKSIGQLKEVLSHKKTQLMEIQDDIAREETYLHQHEQIKGALENKLEHAGDNHTDITEQRYLQELVIKQKKAQDHMVFLMRKLRDFVGEHYPRPTKAQIDTWKTKRHWLGRVANQKQDSEEYTPLQNMLEILMNKSVDSPHDPYMDLNSTHWSPYVELLLRCGIVTRHPQDGNKIKLVPFHL